MEVCDGTKHCLLGEDERNCDVNRCPSECTCYYNNDALYVRCQSGWTADTIDNMAAITNVLELTGGSVKKLDQGLLKRFLKLQSLFLTNNGIRDIQTLSFDGLSKLLWLNISQDNFTTLANDAFKGLDMLQGIVIKDVPLTSIAEFAFRGLKELQILVLIRGQDAKARDEEEMSVALRMAVIVGTDFCCWMPVIVMGLLSQTGAVIIQPHMYAWTVVFILPINSSLNPYLYTIFSMISARCSASGSRDSSNAAQQGAPKLSTSSDIAVCRRANTCPEDDTRL
ncbi:slit homolog 1 protein-like [Acanthaster planci]|uniref:Slit homolog 1 protein-like n=1 Tax=Acanthaster planci TaxID=133434 RepID=A0A8B7ZXJ4_ACAPL|nr:slit homolog 1 protein-like [Acanthaster planci]